MAERFSFSKKNPTIATAIGIISSQKLYNRYIKSLSCWKRKEDTL